MALYLFTGLSAGTYTSRSIRARRCFGSRTHQSRRDRQHFANDSNANPATVVLATNSSSNLPLIRIRAKWCYRYVTCNMSDKTATATAMTAGMQR